ncbi:glyceraldehyde 3-phosphate dehydrogenase [Sporomusaceae bacterium BoRhaA]|uniref:type I glyceraldehyde-3-phosphate dehydrogenase n=1 Tax=Pelorhabdus rhamnosifermentans TaxID=2772457 RepID=UPI001C05EE03|nr:type I glyceraldehyde-3-phosphate dehydrogenase [Pelorhabdus rhamnosifermentans]MBU2700484.1 glyceraldehyde 3-phosphate dehydrogenase [Pelorhabdus rhamnosifermentans]
MITKVGINGFGRIGRMCLRAALQNKNIQVVAINSTSDSFSSAHLIEYDSIHGKLNNKVEATEDQIIIDGQPIKMISDRNPANLPWGKLGVDIVIEATGKFNSSKDCEVHLRNGAKKVIISAPAKDSTPTIVMGVNETTYNSQFHKVISNASCTTNCLAPIVKVIHGNFGIVNGLMSTVHAFTTDQRSLDNSHKDPRRSRSCMQSIVPTTTGAAKAIGLVIPELKGKLNGVSVRVPVPDVSLVDLVVELEQDITVDKINNALRTAAEGSMLGIIEYCDKPLVSIDFLGNKHSAIVDALSTLVVAKRTAKILAWYDNEWAYSCRVIDLAQYVGKTLCKEKLDNIKIKAVG